MYKNLLQATLVFYKIAEKSLNVLAGNETLKLAVDFVVSGYRYNPSFENSIPFLDHLTFFIAKDPRMVAVSAKDLGKITFFQNKSDGELSEVDSDDKKRASTTLGRYIKRIFIKDYIKNKERNFEDISYVLDDNFIDKFVQAVNIKVLDIFNMIGKDLDQISGEDLQSFYGKSDVNSCMSGGDCSKVEILSKNSDVVSLVTMNDSARALLWTTDDGTKVLDRIYPPGSKYILPFREWAIKKGYVYRENLEQLISSSRTVELSDGKTHKVTLSVGDVRKFPYLDTFRFGEFSDDLQELTLSNNINFGDCLFTSTEGSFTGVENYDIDIEFSNICPDCGEDFDIEDPYSGINDEEESICSSCSENYTICEYCNETFNINNMNTLNDSLYCEDCYNNQTFECDDCGDRESVEDNSGYLDDDGRYYCSDCVEKYSNCEECSRLIVDDEEANIVHDESGAIKAYCDDCFDSDDFVKCIKCGEMLDFEPEDRLCFNCSEEEEAAKKKQMEGSIDKKQLMLPYSEEEEEVNEMIADASKKVRSLFIVANLLQKILN